MGLRRSIAGVTTLKLYQALLGFIGVVVFTRITGQETLGQYFLYIAIVTLSSVVASAGVNGAAEKRISEGEPAGQVYTGAVLIKALAFLATAAGLLLIRSYVNSYLGFDAVFLIIAGVATREGSRLAKRVLRGEDRVPVAIGLSSVRSSLFYLLGAIILFRDGGVVGLVYIFISSHVLVTVLAILLQRTRPGPLSIERCWSIVDYAKSNVITSIGGIIYNRMDVVLLGFFVTPSAIAAYEIAWRLSSLGIIFSTSISISLFPKISAWYSENEIEKIKKTLNNALVPSLGFVIPLWVGGTVLSTEILTILYGEEYAIASLSLSIILFERIFRAANNVVARCLHAVNRPGFSAKATLISIFANLVLNLLLIPPFGIAGAAIGTSISFGMKLLIESIYLQRIMRITYPFREIVWMFIVATVMGAVVALFKQYVRPDKVVMLALLILLGGILYLALLAMSKSIRQRVLSYFKNFSPRK